jgi:hypothetical protein
VLVLGGIPYVTPELRLSQAWVSFVLYGRAVCLAVCIIRLVYATGPSFTDWQSAATIVLFHVYAFYAASRLVCLVNSDEVRGMLAAVDDHTSLELAHRIHKQSKYVGWFVIVLAAAASLAAYISYLPLFFDPFYIGPDAKLWDQAYGWLSGFAFIILIPPIVCCAFATFALMWLLLSLTTMQLEGSFDKLHPMLAELGLDRYTRQGGKVTSSTVSTLHLSSTALNTFHCSWNKGFKQYQRMQWALGDSQALGLLVGCIGMSTPATLLFRGFAFDASVHWANALRIFTAGGLVGPINTAGVLFPALICTLTMRRLQHNALQLVIDNKSQFRFVSDLCQTRSLTCYVAYVLPVNRTIVCTAALVVLASYVPWFLLGFRGKTLLGMLEGASTITGGSAVLGRLAIVAGTTLLLLCALRRLNTSNIRPAAKHRGHASGGGRGSSASSRGSAGASKAEPS